MDSGVVFRAAASVKCLACTMLPSSRNKLLSAVQRVSTVLLRPLSSGAFSAARSPTSPRLASESSKNTVVNRILGSRGARKLPAPGCPASPVPVLDLWSSRGHSRLFSTTSTTTPTFTSSPLSMGGAFASGLQSSLLQVSIPTVTATRGRAQIYYQPSAWKRVNKHGIERKLRSPGGIEVLWRRFLKKRHSLTPFDRIIPGTYGGQVLPQHHLKYNQQLVRRDVRKRINQTLGKRKY